MSTVAAKFRIRLIDLGSAYMLVRSVDSPTFAIRFDIPTALVDCIKNGTWRVKETEVLVVYPVSVFDFVEAVAVAPT